MTLLRQKLTKHHGSQHRTGHIQIKHPFKGIQIQMEEVPVSRNGGLFFIAAGTVDQNIDMTEMGDDLVTGSLQTLPIQHIGLHGNGVAAKGIDLIGDFLRTFHEQIQQRYLHALFCHFSGHGAADDAAGTGNNSHLAADIKADVIHFSLPPLNSHTQIDHFDIAVGTAVEAHTAGHAFFTADLHGIGIRNFGREIGADGLAKLTAFTAAAI